MLTQEQINFYHHQGYLHIPHLFTAEETQKLSDEMDRLVEDWAFTSPGWSGPWRQAYMDPETEQKSKLTAMHDQAQAARGAGQGQGGRPVPGAVVLRVPEEDQLDRGRRGRR